MLTGDFLDDRSLAVAELKREMKSMKNMKHSLPVPIPFLFHLNNFFYEEFQVMMIPVFLVRVRLKQSASRRQTTSV